MRALAVLLLVAAVAAGCFTVYAAIQAAAADDAPVCYGKAC